MPKVGIGPRDPLERNLLCGTYAEELKVRVKNDFFWSHARLAGGQEQGPGIKLEPLDLPRHAPPGPEAEIDPTCSIMVLPFSPPEDPRFIPRIVWTGISCFFPCPEPDSQGLQRGLLDASAIADPAHSCMVACQPCTWERTVP